jgi:predicted glycosyltransferase
MSDGRRLLFYSHNGVGVGHVHRQLKLATAYRRHAPDAAVLLVTGSHAAGTLEWPPGVDYLKLPSIRMIDRYENWEPREVGVSIKRLMRLRSDLIRQAVRRFRPDLLVADFMPAGPYGELLPALTELAVRGGRAVAGFRDIVDDPEFVRDLWARTGVYDVLREHYAGVCVYGAREVVDYEAEYGLTTAVAPHLAYSGYLAPSAVPAQCEQRPLVVCTTGGGVDGGSVIAAFLAAAELLHAEVGGTWLAVTGPLLDEAEHQRLSELAGAGGVEVRRSIPDLPGVLAAADAVVAMTGYNTSCQLLSARAPAMVVPRAGPSQEQRLRAARLAAWGAAKVVDPDEASGERIAAGIAAMLAGERPPRAPVALDGLERAVQFFDDVAAGAPLEAR